MTITTPGARRAGTEADGRELRDSVTAGLTDPLAEILRTLQRLALAHLEPAGTNLDPHLLARARHLAHGLQQVVDELVADGTQRGALDGREPQETVLVAAALDSAARSAAPALGTREVVVRCPPRAAIVTNPLRFADLLVELFEAAARATAGDGAGLRVRAERRRGELLVELDDVRLPSDALDRLRRLARSLGGSVQPGAGSTPGGVCLWMPQQRGTDATKNGAPPPSPPDHVG